MQRTLNNKEIREEILWSKEAAYDVAPHIGSLVFKSPTTLSISAGRFIYFRQRKQLRGLSLYFINHRLQAVKINLYGDDLKQLLNIITFYLASTRSYKPKAQHVTIDNKNVSIVPRFNEGLNGESPTSYTTQFKIIGKVTHTYSYLTNAELSALLSFITTLRTFVDANV